MKELLLAVWCGLCWGQAIETVLPRTAPLRELPADWRERQHRQIMDYYQRRIEETPAVRDRAWASATPAAHRRRLRGMLGLMPQPGRQARATVIARGDVQVEQVELALDRDWTVHGALYLPAGATRAVIAQAEPGPWVRELLSRRVAVALLPTIARSADYPLGRKLRGRDRRQLLHRLGFIAGRSLAGLEVEQILALSDWLAARPAIRQVSALGGMSALYAAAVEPRIASAAVIDYFDQRQRAWQDPVDEMLWGQLRAFGDAEVAALIAPRPLVLAYRQAPASAGKEWARAQKRHPAIRVLDGKADAAAAAATALAGGEPGAPVAVTPRAPDAESHFDALLQYMRRLDAGTDAVREAYWRLSATPKPARAQKAGHLRRELAGLLGIPTAQPAPLAPRTRLIQVTDKFAAYDVMLGVFEGVEAYGHLLVPRLPQRRLPAVICQHGLNGQPKDITGVGAQPDKVYHAFGGHLAQQGYVVFAPYVVVPVPQAGLINPIVRQAASLGGMRTGIETAKLRRIVDFLVAQPFVDPARIGYYGLSYGGYSTLWMGAMEPRIQAVIVSGHFNDWRTKITNEELTTSYLFHPDEDFYNWNVLNRFTHTELIAAMYPKAVMVEFADRDGTTTPEWHERGWSQVAAYARVWGQEDRVQRDVFHGVHEIGGMGTSTFLDRWLRPEQPSGRDYKYLLWPSGRDTPGLADNAEDTLPFIRHELKGSLRSTFRAAAFEGVALRLSRTGDAGELVVRYGSRPGAADLGEARLKPGTVHPLYDLWYEARVSARRLDPGRLYHLELRAETGGYVLYGPRRLGGQSRDGEFGFAYRVLGNQPVGEDTHEFVRRYLDPPGGGPAVASGPPAEPGEIVIDGSWSVRAAPGDEVLETAAAGLRRFFAAALQQPLQGSARAIALEVAPSVEGVHTAEGFRITAGPGGVRIQGITARGALRGAYRLEDVLRERSGPYLSPGSTVRNARFGTRITTSILPGGERYTETSRPLLYTDGLLERISRDGFNALWVWLNTEEAAMTSAIFPELDDRDAPERLARLQDLARRARRFGIDVFIYLATGYHHHIPAAFYEKYPEVKGVGWGTPMCTSDERVRRYHAEIVRNIFRRAPDLRGMVVIYDSEGFYYCGNHDRNRERCPRCRRSTSEGLAHQVLTNLNDAMHEAGGGSKQLIAWNYGHDYTWIRKLIPMLPKDILFQVDFSKGGVVVRDGVRHETGDYNLTLVGPPEHFVKQHRDARAAQLGFIIKTEHAVSQEFIFTPYIPGMEQWQRRISRMREFDAAGWFGNWCHYGYLASLPARLINGMSFDPAPPGPTMLEALARGEYGQGAAPHVLRAWQAFSDGIRQFPYSDHVSRIPGPLQKGPSHPLFLDPKVPGFGRWRAWQNDLKWTEPWGPRIAAKYLSVVRQHFQEGIAALEAAREASPAPYRAALDGEWRIARTIAASLTTTLHLIEWIEARDAWAAGRREAADRLEAVALAERRNALDVLPLLDADSRLGYASEGGGVLRGGLFTPELVRWKVGQLDDVLVRQLPALTGRAPRRIPTALEAPVQ